MSFNKGKLQAKYIHFGVVLRTRDKILAENGVHDEVRFEDEQQENE